MSSTRTQPSPKHLWKPPNYSTAIRPTPTCVNNPRSPLANRGARHLLAKRINLSGVEPLCRTECETAFGRYSFWLEWHSWPRSSSCCALSCSRSQACAKNQDLLWSSEEQSSNHQTRLRGQVLLLVRQPFPSWRFGWNIEKRRLKSRRRASPRRDNLKLQSIGWSSRVWRRQLFP